MRILVLVVTVHSVFWMGCQATKDLEVCQGENKSLQQQLAEQAEVHKKQIHGQYEAYLKLFNTLAAFQQDAKVKAAQYADLIQRLESDLAAARETIVQLGGKLETENVGPAVETAVEGN